MYTPDLYRTEKYNPAKWFISGWTIKYERYRCFLTFLTPRKIKCSEEILLFNSGSAVNHIIYDLVEFKQQLYIYDSDDKKLEFHGFSNLDCSDKYLIKIEFPHEKPFSRGEYRTVTIDYVLEYPTFVGYFAQLEIPLNLADTVYIFFEKPKEYQTELMLFKRRGETLTFLDIERRRADDELLIDESDIKLQIVGNKISKSEDLVVLINHNLHKEQEMWFNTGILFGWLSSVFILTELIVVLSKMSNLSSFLKYVPVIIPLAVAAITALIIIKGWIFTQDLDWILNDIDQKNGILFTYSRIYISLICIIVFELGATISICTLSAIT